MGPRTLRRAVLVALLLALAIGASGCVSGFLYTKTTTPIVVNFDDTKKAPARKGGSWYTLVIPAVVIDPQFDWGSIAIGDAMKKIGLETVHYADMEETSVLGLWRRRTLYVYGE